ncbi:MAG TPA: HAMP domain-containing protein, partial [Terriglobales bacterium]|nr:HAMP domain-containing protein [Terriglobales bacterium]
MVSERWRQFRIYLERHALWPTSRLARFTLYLLGVDVFLIAYSSLARLWHGSASVQGWIFFIAYVVVFLGLILAFRWVRQRVMWALRNRLIVTYTFIGVIPVLLLVLMGMLVTYVFVGQFATYVASSDLQTQIGELDAVNERLASEIAMALRDGKAVTPEILNRGNATEEMFPNRHVTAWFKDKSYVLSLRDNDRSPASPIAMPPAGKGDRSVLAIDGNRMYLRSVRELPVGNDKVVVISGVPLDVGIMAKVAEQMGVVSMQAFVKTSENKQQVPKGTKLSIAGSHEELNLNEPTTGGAETEPIESPAPLPAPKGFFDRQVTFASTVPGLDWSNGEDRNILMIVHTRPSLMYGRLFRTVGEFVNVVAFALIAVAIFFGLIELVALIIGVRLTKTITASVYKLYQGTRHVNLGDFTHRIAVTRTDQLAALETSFNSMTENIQRLLKEQKEKQR